MGSVLCGEDKNIFLFYFEVRHRRCFGSITNNCCVLLCIVAYCVLLCIVFCCVLHIESNTTIFHPVVQ